MGDTTHTQEPTETPSQSGADSTSEFDFEDELKRQNINSMIEIYGEEYLAKIGILT